MLLIIQIMILIIVISFLQVETIGDAYMVVGGAPERQNNHAKLICDMALDMVEAIMDLKDPSTGTRPYLGTEMDLKELSTGTRPYLGTDMDHNDPSTGTRPYLGTEMDLNTFSCEGYVPATIIFACNMVQ